jgi:hypothetical protein
VRLEVLNNWSLVGTAPPPDVRLEAFNNWISIKTGFE